MVDRDSNGLPIPFAFPTMKSDAVSERFDKQVQANMAKLFPKMEALKSIAPVIKSEPLHNWGPGIPSPGEPEGWHRFMFPPEVEPPKLPDLTPGIRRDSADTGWNINSGWENPANPLNLSTYEAQKAPSYEVPNLLDIGKAEASSPPLGGFKSPEILSFSAPDVSYETPSSGLSKILNDTIIETPDSVKSPLEIATAYLNRVQSQSVEVTPEPEKDFLTVSMRAFREFQETFQRDLQTRYTEDYGPGKPWGESFGKSLYVKDTSAGQLHVHSPMGFVTGAKLNGERISNYDAAMIDILSGKVSGDTEEW
jgi:hypothetical protein